MDFQLENEYFNFVFCSILFEFTSNGSTVNEDGEIEK